VKAELLVQLHLEPVREEYLARGLEVVTGASGSIKAIQDVLISEGWSREGITSKACGGCGRLCSKARDTAGMARTLATGAGACARLRRRLRGLARAL
jgi:hypothetical protein